MAYSGICRSQLNEIKGFKGHDPYLPHTLGHEGSGVVLEVGPGVTKVVPGDHVVLSWLKASGIEAGGSRYTSSQGTVNSGPISTLLHVAVVSENRLIPISQTLPLRLAALLGCAIPTGAGIVFHQLQVARGDSCAIFGVGGIGLSALIAARFLGASPLIAIDVSEEKLNRAKLLGATHGINSGREDPIAQIREITRGEGAQKVMECVGKSDAMEMAFQATSTKGICVIAGNLPKGTKMQIDPFDLISGKKIIGSWGGATHMDRDISSYIEMVFDQQTALEQLITHETELSEINTLFQLLEEGKLGRGLIRFT